jgi:putative transposase
MKLEGEKVQYEKLDEAIRTGRFVRNSIIRAWIDGEIKSRNDAYKYCKVLADNPEFPWAKKPIIDGTTSSCRKGLGSH